MKDLTFTISQRAHHLVRQLICNWNFVNVFFLGINCSWRLTVEAEGCILCAPAQFHSSDIWTEMKVEFHIFIKLFEELEEVGESATLTSGQWPPCLREASYPSSFCFNILTHNWNDSNNLAISSLPGGGHRRHCGAAVRAADHQAFLLLGDASLGRTPTEDVVVGYH